MTASGNDDICGAILRQLETDFLLGIRAVPLRPPKPRPAARTQGAAPAAHAPAGHPAPARTPAAPAASPAVHSNVDASLRCQQLTRDEIARREALLRELDEKQVRQCRRCGLHHTRTRTVFGQGNPAARLVFVGEAPGHDEDIQGLAFVGRAGQLLTKMIEAGMGLAREDVFICNILKCRPPNNRTPAPDEISACWPLLDQQLRILQPEVIVALGAPASQTLLRTGESIGRLRGRWHDYYISGAPGMGEPTPLMPTYHPAYLLRNPADKVKAWNDLQMVMARLGLPLPQK